ncbi:hypothetical protein BCR39DRAFT_555274 [Naematelia encephala]|uniref:Uncharacterized protein n=1 Tax=Naematelia encephala TaxID=71784 RepID=A0A1Y2ADG0_9TREE|nr:hypothetical protein BCR39DRAFT_555274 [Naematelia encephala]
MPLHLPSLGHHRSSSRSDKDAEETYVPTSPKAATRVTIQPQPHRSVTSSSSSSTTGGSSSHPPSILRKTTTRSSLDTTSSPTSSASASAPSFAHRMSSLSMDRTETISSDPYTDDERDDTSTPATSVSSLHGQCPLPSSSPSTKFPFFVMSLSSTSTLSFIALPTAMRPKILDAIHQAWKKGISKAGQVDYAPELMKKHKEKGCDGGVWEVQMKGNCWMPDSAEQVSSKRILINIMTAVAREGYSLTSSFRTSAKDSGKDTLIFLQGEPDPDPIFFAVAFYSHDRVWIIDAEADVGQALEDGIKNFWVDGIKDIRTRERHCREIRLRGSPWTAHSTSALISARCIHLGIMKNITHYERGYDFVGSVDMADKEEAELPCTFYRAKWGPERAVWKMAE